MPYDSLRMVQPFTILVMFSLLMFMLVKTEKRKRKTTGFFAGRTTSRNNTSINSMFKFITSLLNLYDTSHILD